MHTEVQRVLDAPHGATLVLVPRAEDADWLNINRPVFAQRELRVVLFCDTETTVALARQAVDFFDWISHRVECPNRPPRFAVAGIRCALAARAPGIVWQGGDLEATFAAARPLGKLYKLSASRPYGELLAELREHPRAWIAFTDVDSHFRLRHVRWALAEVGTRTRAILVEPTVHSPGWWPVHARLAAPREARAQLETAGASFPGRLAALNELEPEAIKMMQFYLEHGISEAALNDLLTGAQQFPEPKPQRTWEEIGRQFAPLLLRGEAPPPLMRAFTPALLRQFRETEFAALHQRLEAGESVTFEELASWTAWATKPIPDLSSRQPELAAEMWLRSREPAQIRWDVLILWGTVMMDLDAAESWARRAVSEKHPGALLMLASVRQVQGHHDEAESLIQGALAHEEQAQGIERIRTTTAPTTLAGALMARGNYQEAEALLRQALSASEQDREGKNFLRGALILQLARALSKQGRYGEAELLLRQSLDDPEQLQGIQFLYKSAHLDELAKAVSARGRYAEAELLLRQSLALMQDTMGPEHPLAGASMHDLATLLRLQGRFAEAEPLYRQAISIGEHTPGIERHAYYVGSVSGLAATLRVQGKYEEAEARQREALNLLERTVGSEHPAYAAALHGLGCIRQDQARYVEAETLFRRSLALREKALGPSHHELCPALSNLGATLAQQGRPEEGVPFILRALEIARAALEPNPPEIAQILNLLAQIQDASGSQEAPETARKALDALHRTLGPNHPTTQRVSPMLQAIIAKGRQETAER